MQELLTQLKENLGFVLVCIAIVAALALAAKFSERFMKEIRKVSTARRVSIIGICAAIATVLHMLDFPLLFLAPGFYKLDFSELPVLLCGFFLGPSATVACEGIKILLKLLLKGTSTAFVGDFANFVVGCSFVLPATIGYQAAMMAPTEILARQHYKSARAMLEPLGIRCGLLIGSICITIFGSAFNAIYLLPKFAQLYQLPLDSIIAMGAEINGNIHNVSTFVFFCVAPLNLLKAAMVSVLTMLLYKRVARPLFGKAL